MLHCPFLHDCRFLEPALACSTVFTGNGLSSAFRSSGSSSGGSRSSGFDPAAAQRLLELSQSYDTQQPGDRSFYKQLSVEERVARIQMLLQHGVTEATVEKMIKRH